MSFYYYRFSLFLLSAMVVISCQKAVNPEKEKEKIRAQMQGIAEAHFEKDAAKFYAPYNDSWYDAREGQIQQLKKATVLPGTQEYLDQMQVIGMDTTHEPLVEISEDGTMASYMAAILLRGMLKGTPVFWVVSWQSVLKKIDNEWRIISNANTQATPEAGAELILEQSKNQIGALSEESSIYALAECKSPGGTFSTLLISNSKAARMEQQFGEDHIALKHGEDTSWSRDLKNPGNEVAIDELTKMFVKGHELHWLSFRPEDRLGEPSYKGIEQYNGQTSFKIAFKDALDRLVFFYYDFENYRPLGFEISGNRVGERVKVFFDNWQTEGDMMVFYKATFEDGLNLFEYEFSEVKIGERGAYDLENKTSLMTLGE